MEGAMTAAPGCRILTPRLVIRDFDEADLPAVHAFRSDPEVARFMQDFDAESLEQSRAWLDGVIYHNRVQPRVAYNLAIELRSLSKAIGWIGIGDSERHPGPGECGFGYMLDRAHWGQGYATEAARAILAFAFQELGAQHISSWCYAENAASARVLEKAGLTLIKRYDDIESKSGRPITCLEYEIHRADWSGPATPAT
jgi:RimJ/RimL family protein N-acetyltransferase